MLTRVFLTLIWTLFAGLGMVNAEGVLQPVFTSHGRITNIRWSEDGDVLVFQDATLNAWSVHRPENDLAAGVESVNTWPYRDLFDESEHLIPDLATDEGGNIGFVFPSPDERYLVYPANPFDTELYGWPLVIMDTHTQQTTKTGITVFSLNEFSWFYDITWSSGSRVFVVQLETGFGDSRTYYVTGFAPDLQDVSYVQLEQVTIAGEQMGLLRTFADLSQDGSRVLLSATYAPSDVIQDHRLIILDVEKPSQSQIIVQDETVIGAAFSPDETAVYYVGDNGLAKYDLVTSETQILDALITSDCFARALFSPNLSYLALVENGNFESAVYVLAITE